MEPWIEKLTSYNRPLVRWVLFALTLAGLIMLYPNYHAFPYEYQRGRPWVYPDLVSPIDFALEKSKEALEEERQLIIDQAPIYFRETQAPNLVLASLDSLRTFAAQDSLLMLDTAYIDLLDELSGRNSLLILDRALEIQNETLNTYILSEDRARRVALSTVMSLYRWPEGVGLIDRERFADVLSRREKQLKSVLRPNLEFDEQFSNEILEDRLKRLSPFEGLVGQGDVIAFEGMIVTEEVFRKLEALKQAFASSSGGEGLWKEQLGVGMLTGILLLMLYLFLRKFRAFVLEDFARMTFILVFWLLMAAMARFALQFGSDYLLLVPLPVLPIVMRAFFDTRLALFVHMLVILSIGLLSSEGLAIVLLHFVAGFYAIITVDLLYKRAQLFVTLTKVVAIYGSVYIALLLFRDTAWEDIPWRDFIYLGINGTLALSAFPLIYLSERVFGLVSDLSLLELTDTNNPLLRELAETAPGTFQHSLQVANLAEAAIVRINGNPLLIRAGALYHDIGKMQNPMYFIENQASGLNPHDELGFDESAAIIIGHVKAGIKRAREAKLPETLIDFIRTHHGTSTVQYFYKQHMKNFPDEEVDLRKFTYPGPRPFNKETAVLMMADSVEAASRSIRSRQRKDLEDLVEKIVNAQMAEKQFEEAAITLREISEVKEEFKRKLKDIYHFRVAYPT